MAQAFLQLELLLVDSFVSNNSPWLALTVLPSAFSRISDAGHHSYHALTRIVLYRTVRGAPAETTSPAAAASASTSSSLLAATRRYPGSLAKPSEVGFLARPSHETASLYRTSFRISRVRAPLHRRQWAAERLRSVLSRMTGIAPCMDGRVFFYFNPGNANGFFVPVPF